MAETDLEKFVEAPGRDEKIKQVREMIDRMGIEYLYLQFVSVTGKIMGKGIPADHWESVAKKGFQLVYGCLLYTSPSPRDRTRSRMPSSA